MTKLHAVSKLRPQRFVERIHQAGAFPGAMIEVLSKVSDVTYNISVDRVSGRIYSKANSGWLN